MNTAVKIEKIEQNQNFTTYSIKQLSRLSAERLMHLQRAADADLARAKAEKERIDTAIALKYQTQSKDLRDRLEKEYGVVHFNDGNIKVTQDIAKKADWNQQHLRSIAKRIEKSGEDPREYLTITYRVTERKFNAWPEPLRDQFMPARVTKPGKVTFTLQHADDKEASR